MHVLHQGRATYTLVHPPKTPSESPRVERITMGTNAAAGEVRQLLVGDSWKMSEIPKEDLVKVEAGELSKDEVGCLITEVVVPGFVWQDHAFLTQSGLEDLFKGHEDGEKWVKELTAHIRQDN
jgi:predicted cupin superfamily sugar epimerase